MRQKLFHSSLCTAILVLAIASPALAQDSAANVKIRTLSGNEISAVLVELNADNLIVSQTTQDTIPNDTVASIQFQPQPAIAPGRYDVKLVDGTTLNADSFILTKQLLSLELHEQVKLDVKTRNVQYIRLVIHESEDLENQWSELTSAPPKTGDGLVVNRSDILEIIEGVVGNIDQERIDFNLNGQQARIKRTKVDGIVFYHAVGRELVDATCRVRLIGDSSLTVRSAIVDEDKLNCTLVCGAKFLVPLSKIVSLDFASGRSVFLSDIKPTSQDWEPLIASSAILGQLKSMRLPKTNSSYDNSPLTLKFFPEKGVSFLSETRQFDHGFAMVGGSKLVFNLSGEYKTLTGQVGFAPRSSTDGNAKFVVIADGKRIFDQSLKKSDALDPIELNLKIDDVQRLVFIVDYNDGRAVGDLLHLCDLKVSK